MRRLTLAAALAAFLLIALAVVSLTLTSSGTDPEPAPGVTADPVVRPTRAATRSTSGRVRPEARRSAPEPARPSAEARVESAQSSPPVTPACERFCTLKRPRGLQRCVDAGLPAADCELQLDELIAACIQHQCALQVSQPTEADRVAVADAHAREVFGPDAVRIADTPVLGAGGAPASQMFLYALDGQPLQRQDLLDALAAGSPESEVDALVGCVEVGATLDAPPVVAYWRGAPVEVTRHHAAVAALRATRGEGEYTLRAVHRSAAFPLLEYVAPSGGSVFFDPASGRVLGQLRISQRAAGPRAQELALNRESIRRQWANRMEVTR